MSETVSLLYNASVTIGVVLVVVVILVKLRFLLYLNPVPSVLSDSPLPTDLAAGVSFKTLAVVVVAADATVVVLVVAVMMVVPVLVAPAMATRGKNNRNNACFCMLISGT